MPGSKSSGFLAHVSMICCADVGLHHGGHEVVLGPVVLIAGGVGEDFADGDFVAVGEAGEIFADGVVEGELALLLQEEGWPPR